MNAEHTLIGCLMQDANLVDLAQGAGLTPKHFTSAKLMHLWLCALKLRAAAKPADMTGLHLEGGDLTEIMECERSAPTTIYFQQALDKVLDGFAARQVLMLSKELGEASRDGREAMAAKADEILKALDRKSVENESNDTIGAQVEEIAIAKIENRKDSRVRVEWPCERMNASFTDIMPHELVLIGARPKCGKSSIVLQMAGHNLRRGLKVAYFTLETAATAAFAQIAGQMARVNIRLLNQEPKDKQQKYLEAIRWLRASKRLALFDRVMSIDALEGRCRVLAASFQPDVIIIDHFHQISNEKAKGSYDKATDISLRLVELRKRAGCAVIVAFQLNRGSENDERPPRSSDARDSGAIEQVAHRMALLHRPKDDFNGQPQIGPEVGHRSIYDYYIMQELLRDGPSGVSVRAKYHSTQTVFTE